MTELRIASDHNVTRKQFEWGTFGRSGKDDMSLITLDKMSDSHLLHCIGNVLAVPSAYKLDTLYSLLDEAEYRHVNKIFVGEYQ